MKKYKIADFYKGWFVGSFEPSILKEDFEVGVITHTKGEFHQDHFHKEAIEINLVLSGSIKINGEIFSENEIFVLYPYEVSQAEFLTDVKILVVRNKSNPSDKYPFDIVDNS